MLQNPTLSVHNIKSLSFIALFFRQYLDVAQNIAFEVVTFSYHNNWLSHIFESQGFSVHSAFYNGSGVDQKPLASIEPELFELSSMDLSYV